MEEFDKEETVEEVSEEPKIEEAVPASERNTNAPTGWTYSANTNQYVSWDGSKDPNSAQWIPGEETKSTNQPPRKEYGTQYGYYSNGGFAPNYYSSSGPNPYEKSNGYQWDYNRYESAGEKQEPKKRSGKGFKVFLGIVAALLGCCVIALAAFGIYALVNGETGLPMLDKTHNPSSEEISDADRPQKNRETPPLSLEEKPDSEDIFSADGKLSATSIYKAVSPSIVGVVQYRYNYSMSPYGQGSGIILTEDGYILTNAHVIANADSVKVVLYNEEEYEAEVIGSDDQTDIAVLKIDAQNLTAAKLGDSDDIEIGETVYVLGNPGGLVLQSSFTEGIISGLNRVVAAQDSNYSMTLIQTSAAINPGNSGGALINEYAQVIGIASSKLVSEEYESIGFAIPTRTAKAIVDDLIANGYVSGRAILGITGRSIDSTMARYYQIPMGVQIASITDESSFKWTEVQIGDIITKMDDTEITGMNDVYTFLAKHAPGDEVEVEIFRYSTTRNNDRTFTVKVKLIEYKG